MIQPAAMSGDGSCTGVRHIGNQNTLQQVTPVPVLLTRMLVCPGPFLFLLLPEDLTAIFEIIAA
jgi:hypothetical protein